MTLRAIRPSRCQADKNISYLSLKKLDVTVAKLHLLALNAELTVLAWIKQITQVSSLDSLFTAINVNDYGMSSTRRHQAQHTSMFALDKGCASVVLTLRVSRASLFIQTLDNPLLDDRVSSLSKLTKQLLQGSQKGDDPRTDQMKGGQLKSPGLATQRDSSLTVKQGCHLTMADWVQGRRPENRLGVKGTTRTRAGMPKRMLPNCQQ